MVAVSAPTPQPTSPAPTSPNPVQGIQNQFGLSVPPWLYPILACLAVVAAFALLYKPLGAPTVMLGKLIGRTVISLRKASKAARRRAVFADHLESAMRRLAEKEEWRDSRFAELEAEVETERLSGMGKLSRRFGGNAGAKISRLPSLTVALRTRTDRLVVLEGDPGAGKSVALRHVTQAMASAASHRPSEKSVLPIYVNLKTFRPEGGSPSAEDVREFVLASMNPAQSRDIDRFIEDEFDRGREAGLWRFLFDSFDEIPAILSAIEAGPIIEEYVDAISGFIGMGSSRGVIASREFRGPGRTGWPRFRVMPLTTKRRAMLIRRADLDDQHERMLLDGLADMDAGVVQLADNPLFLSLLCEYVRDQGALPASTHAVLESYVQSRLRRDQQRIEHRFAVSIDAARSVAEEMAFRMLSSPEIGLSVSRSRIVALVAGQLHLATDEVAAALDALIYTKLVRFSDDDATGTTEDAAVTFSHRRIQEYFATCVTIRDRSRISLTELLTNGRWRETVVAMLQTQQAEDSADLLAEIEHLLLARIADDDRPLWPAGCLHLLDILANGLRPEQAAGLPVTAVADTVLRQAWTDGTRLDRKWTIELCAAAGTERAVDYLTFAFDSESLWLRDQAYAQVRAVGPAVSRLEPQIRRTLVDMSVGGVLHRERRSVRTQLQRLSDPKPLLRTVWLLLAAPTVMAVTSTLVYLAYLIEYPPLSLTSLLAPAAMLLTRLRLASAEKQARYANTILRRLRLPGMFSHAVASLSIMLGAFSFICVLILALGFALDHEWPTTMTIIASTLAALAILWPYGALLSAKTGAWTSPVLLPLLAFYLTVPAGTGTLAGIRRFNRKTAKIVLGLIPISIVAFVLSQLADKFLGSSSVYLSAFTLIPVAAIAMALIVLLRNYYRDRRTAALVGRSDVDADPVLAIQDTLTKLESAEALHFLLLEIGRRHLHRRPDVADFLGFLAGRLETRTAPTSHQDWVDWWDSHKHRSPLLQPSSESLDELARLLEDARRSSAFQS
jgi:hypothetical protein